MVFGSGKIAPAVKWSGRRPLDWGAVVVLTVIVAAVALRYWLTAGLPITAHAHGTYDDALFIRLAQSFAAGDWLGEYDKLTLVKAPLYPLFIGANYLLGLQFKTMEHLLYILASLVFYFALVRASVNRYLALIPFLFLLFNPYHHSSVERGWFYAALVLLVVAGFQYMISIRAASGRVKLNHAFLLGLVLAALYLSREETIWLYPLLIVAFGLLIYQPGWHEMVPVSARLLPMLLLGMAIPLAAVMGANYLKYGFFGVTDTSIKSFKSATKLMKSVRTDEEIPFVDVTHKALEQMFSVSPAFARFQPYLEGDLGRQWGSLMCRRHTQACNEIGGGYYFWTLRDALAAEGDFQSVDQMSKVFSDIGSELKQACDSGRLDCSRWVWPVRYPIRADRLDDYMAKLPGMMRYMVTGMNGRLPGYGPPRGPQQMLEVFRQLSNASLMPEAQQDQFSVSGWLLSDSAEKYIAIVPKPFAAYTNRFSLKASGDVQRHFEDNKYSGMSRFTVEGPCKAGRCELLIMSGGKQALLDQSLIRPGADLRREGLHLHIDSVERKETAHELLGIDKMKIEAFKKIGMPYNHALPYLSLLATIVCMVACYAFVFKGYRSLLLGGVLIVVMGIAARLGVLALFDDFTQSPVVGQIRHFIPVMPLLLLYIGLNFLILFELPAGLRNYRKSAVESFELNSDNDAFL
jgi:hypothetical protein